MRVAKELKNKLKERNGITLIALVITIIVLLILAGVSITMLTGDNSILQKATQSKETTERADAKEQAQLDILAWQSDKISKGENSELNNTVIKEIITGRSYVKEATETSFITKKGEYEIQYSELYKVSKKHLSSGLYDENENLIKTWQELKDDGDIYVVSSGVIMRTNTTKYESMNGILVIDSEVTRISTGTFQRASGLKSIILPDTLTEIENYAFRYCSGLREISIPNGIETIGKNTFDGCTNLAQISIPSSVKNIGNFAFGACSSLTKIDIPNGVENIGEKTFMHCTSLNEINVPESVRSIGKDAFYTLTGNKPLITTINIDKNFGEISGEPWLNPGGTGWEITEVSSSEEIGDRGLIINWIGGQIHYYKFHYTGKDEK